MDERKSCTMCWSYSNGFCKRWKQRISDTTTAEGCDKFSTEKKLNKGMQIRQNKLARKAKKRAEVKEEQKELVRFVDFTEHVIERIDGKWRRPTRTEQGRGVQVKNRIYLEDGHYKMVNRSTLQITKTYGKVPKWAGSHLIEVYERAQKTIAKQEPTSSPRKRCNTCVHFLYGTNKGKLGYYCELTGKSAKSYTQLTKCKAPDYKRKA